MALETERTPATTATGLDGLMSGLRRRTLVALARARRLARPLSKLSARFSHWLQGTRLYRFVSASLLRRILVANLAGLSVVIGGIFYFSEHNVWLIEAKRESLRVQGEIIAAAIASDARVEPGRLIIPTDSLPGMDTQPQPRIDDAFTAHELSIRPERVAPILRRLIQPTKRRARVYSRDGTLVMDSATLLMRGNLNRHEPKVDEGTRMRTKNIWTRFKALMIGEELPVYREIGNANGTSYKEVRRALDGTTTAMLLLNEKGEQIVSTAVPIKRGDKVQGVLLMSTPPGEIDDILAEERALIWVLAIFALIATLVSSFMLTRTVAGPIRRLSASADHVSRNISARHELPEFAQRNDEVGQMASAFAAMTDALYKRAEASESFAADVAHELKNPLTAARSMAEALTYAKTDEQRQEVVNQIQNELKRLNRLITDVSNASRLDAELARQEMGPVDLTGVVGSVAQIFGDILSSDSREVTTEIEAAFTEGAYLVRGHAGRLGQVLTNLVDNAVSFSPEDSTVTVRVRRGDGYVDVAVEDAGPGIPDDRLKIIFDRFYTDRPDTEAVRGKNSGLGLSISREIIRAHGGEIFAENRRGAFQAATEKPLGARFVIRLPAFTSWSRSGMTTGRRATMSQPSASGMAYDAPR